MAQFPSRPSNALSGSQFIQSIPARDYQQRDSKITQEILNGNFPDFLRHLVPINISEKGNTLVYHVMPDYLSVGNDIDYIRAPLDAMNAQKIADSFGCTLPTAKMSNQIWQAAAVRLTPKPMSGMTSNIGGQTYTAQQFLAKKMTDTDSFAEHNRIIQEQLSTNKPGDLIAGHKKDVVLTNELATRPNNVAIHGLHRPSGRAIQGGSWGHDIGYRDYSHGIRLIDRQAKLNGKTVDLVNDVYKNPKFAYLISDEGALQFTSYRKNTTTDNKQKQTLQLNHSLPDDYIHQFIANIEKFLARFIS